MLELLKEMLRRTVARLTGSEPASREDRVVHYASVCNLKTITVPVQSNRR